MKVALFGGSFNPPHIAHIEICKYLILQKDIDEVWMLPSFNHPLGKTLISFEDRFTMCKLSTKELGNKVVVSDIESKLKGEGRTIDTILFLKKLYPDYSFKLVIGSDIIFELSKWKHFDLIKKYAQIILIPRVGCKIENNPYLEGILVLKVQLPDISSTIIKDMIKAGKSIYGMVHPEVERYIKEKKLYL